MNGRFAFACALHGLGKGWRQEQQEPQARQEARQGGAACVHDGDLLSLEESRTGASDWFGSSMVLLGSGTSFPAYQGPSVTIL
ncbi:hypothetical protein LIP_0771 [Limnochorda pilosa]|uniref:Uncharacterized protein n=1 Tax=Limnochorda pilosa TaxID=1555112 RepID=A0A0K2SHP7_LIMPI|nr:hypothetical protein LIP_0771 [Limnochorda pilosa]